MKRFSVAACFASLLFALAISGAAKPVVEADLSAFPVIPLVHTRWLVKDGAPPGIISITQSTDGWLWLASASGLYRFDGVTFSRYRPPSGSNFPTNIQDIRALSDGSVAIRSRYGDFYILRGRTLQGFKQKADDAIRDRNGVIWIAGPGSLFHLNSDGITLNEVGSRLEAPTGPGEVSLLEDKEGSIWLMSGAGICVLRPGSDKFKKIADQTGWGMLQEAPDGSVWATDMGIGKLRRLSPPRSRARHEKWFDDINVSKFLIDRHGNMWFATYGGLTRAHLKGSEYELQSFTKQHGLSGEHSDAIFEDREGNVWVATASGLDQFRPTKVEEIVLPSYLAEARPIAAGLKNDLWVDRFYLPAPDATPQALRKSSSQQSTVSSLYRDPDGVLWTGALDGLWRNDGLKRTRVPYPPEIKWPQVPVFAIAKDAQQGLWISIGPPGTWRLHEGVWQRHGGIPALAGFRATSIVPAPDGSLWFGSLENTLAILHNGQVRRFSAHSGISVGNVLQVAHVDTGAYLGGDDGMNFFDGQRAHRIQGEGGELFSGMTGIVVLDNGDLWANTSRGLVHIAAGELALARRTPSHGVRFRRFDENDGLRGGAAAMLPLPSLVRTSNGELVVSTMSSVFRFDPAKTPRNKLAPAVHVTGVSTDGVPHALAAHIQLPAAPDSVRIDYTGLSLALPQRVRFRYMLEGVDRAWQDAGTRRAAFYTQLSPGRYTFRVTAANEDGVWSQKAAALSFEIPPTPTQTVWFKLSCVIGLALAFWGLHRLRLRIALDRLTRSFEARVAERERIARDLHDTLLQSVQGLILTFERIAKRTPDGQATKPIMQEALALASSVLEEGRDKVGNLRLPSAGGNLGAVLDSFGRHLAKQYALAFQLKRTGTARALQAPAFEELLSIGREAIQNAFVHANATRVDVELIYQERHVSLRVSDNGSGIEDGVRLGKLGHWGIPGMRERASQIGASLELETGPGGSTWRLKLASALAYQPVDESGSPTRPQLSEDLL